jgi:hypothetical protein
MGFIQIRLSVSSNPYFHISIIIQKHTGFKQPDVASLSKVILFACLRKKYLAKTEIFAVLVAVLKNL